MQTFTIDWTHCPRPIEPGLRELVAHAPDVSNAPAGSVSLQFVHDPSLGSTGLSANPSPASVEIRYVRPCDAYRALGRLIGMARSGSPLQPYAETCRFTLTGAMADCSRNGVLNLDAAKALLRRFALMGLNMLMLYTEDTYEVPGEPFFGYLRGRYTHDELRALDDYADALGIEIIPCIQTLAHLEQILQWGAYAHLRDTGGVILAGDDATYALLEKMIRAVSAPFRSRRIHLGMDEAFGIGSGRYREKFGDRNHLDILLDHLNRVLEITRAQGLRPMIWSDMFLRSETGNYYDTSSGLSSSLTGRFPSDVEIVYWDYYHDDSETYAAAIDRHRSLGGEPLMASGVWTWNHLWAALPFSFRTVDACMKACKQKELREAFVTLWGDDGMECDVFSALPGIQLFADHAYADTIDPATLRSNFRGSCDAHLDDWYKAAEIDSVPGDIKPESAGNPSKWLLWDDPFLGIMEPQTAHLSLRAHYAALADLLKQAAGKTSESVRLLFPAQIARVLSLKCELRRDLVAAYQGRDRETLQRILAGDLAELRAETDRLWRIHRQMWLATYKPFGLEVIEKRYGALRTRLESLADRLADYLSGAVDSIPEFETQLEKIIVTDGRLPDGFHDRASTASFIK